MSLPPRILGGNATARLTERFEPLLVVQRGRICPVAAPSGPGVRAVQGFLEVSASWPAAIMGGSTGSSPGTRRSLGHLGWSPSRILLVRPSRVLLFPPPRIVRSGRTQSGLALIITAPFVYSFYCRPGWTRSEWHSPHDWRSQGGYAGDGAGRAATSW